MSLIALVSDVHGDLAALREVILTCERMGCTELWCAGDLVDDGPEPDEVARILEERGVPTVLGNHDRWALEKRAQPLKLATWMFLERLPRSWWSSRDGTRVAMFHASPHGDMDGLLPEAIDAARADTLLDRADADVLVVGHTHVPMLMQVGARMIVNPGSLRRTMHRVGDRLVRGGTFGVLEVETRTFRLFDAAGGELPL